MNTFTRLRLGRLVPLLALVLLGPGCSGGSDTVDVGQPAPKGQTAAGRPGVTPVVPRGDVKRSEVARHVWMETEGKQRRVRVEAAVCLRDRADYGLEFLLCRAKSKEYESLLATSASAHDIHKALLAAGAEAGHPVRFTEGGFSPPTGSRIKVSLEYEDNGKLVSVPAGYWVRNIITKKELESDWVFAGSELRPDPDGNGKPSRYVADDDGSYVCVINLPTAMLDLPLSPKANQQQAFQPFSEHIPEVGTPVIVIFEPVAGTGGTNSTGKN
jgi:hypothetical protein